MTNCDSITDRLNSLNLDIRCISYTNSKNFVLKCNNCNHIWKSRMSNYKRGCPMCNKHPNILDIDGANRFLNMIGINKIVCIYYPGSKTKKSKFKCKKCGFIFNQKLYFYKSKNNDDKLCPCCERAINNYCTTDDVNFILEYRNINIRCTNFSSFKGESTFICLNCGNYFNYNLSSILKKGSKFTPKCCNDRILWDNIDMVNRWLSINRPDLSCIHYSGTTHSDSIFICNICGRVFKKSFNKIKVSNSGCTYCIKSKGEVKIERCLIENNIKYIAQYKPKGCVYKGQLSFDFYLPEYNLCIEYQGEQHEHPVDFFGGEYEFEKVKNRDVCKKKYCTDNFIKILEIWYYDYNNIENIISDIKSNDCIYDN